MLISVDPIPLITILNIRAQILRNRIMFLKPFVSSIAQMILLIQIYCISVYSEIYVVRI